MFRKWGISSYIDKDGINPVEKYIIEDHNVKDITVLLNVIERLSYNGLDLLDTKMCKRLTEDLWELRKDRHRIIFSQDGSIFILLSGFQKSTKKTPKKDIDLATQRLMDYKNNKIERSMGYKFALN